LKDDVLGGARQEFLQDAHGEGARDGLGAVVYLEPVENPAELGLEGNRTETQPPVMSWPVRSLPSRLRNSTSASLRAGLSW